MSQAKCCGQEIMGRMSRAECRGQEVAGRISRAECRGQNVAGSKSQVECQGENVKKKFFLMKYPLQGYQTTSNVIFGYKSSVIYVKFLADSNLEANS